MPTCLYSTLLTSLFIILLLTLFISWPWAYAAYVWHDSTIKSLEINFPNSKISMPKIIHQTYRNQISVPYQWQQASNSCRILHPDYEYKFWSDEESRRLIEEKFPDLLSTFDSYPYDIQRADVIRLVALYLYGGIYLDMDIFCLKPLDNLLKYEIILPRTMPVGLSNDVLLSQAKHPFLLKMINDLSNSNRNYITKYPTVMFTTGPMFLTAHASSYAHRQSIDILSPELYGKYRQNSSQALFRHLKASSWHGKDALMIKWLFRERNKMFSALIILVLIIIMSVYAVQISFHLIHRKDYSLVFHTDEKIKNSNKFF